MFKPEEYLLSFANILVNNPDTNTYTSLETPSAVMSKYAWAVYEVLYDSIVSEDFYLYDMLLTDCEYIMSHYNSSTRSKFSKLLIRVGTDFIKNTSLSEDALLYKDGEVRTICSSAIGLLLVNPLLEGENRLGLMTLDLHVIGRKEREYKLRFLEEAYIQLLEERKEILYAKRLPQDTVPKDWSDIYDKEMIKPAKVRSVGSDESCKASNVLQKTAWRVNTRITNLMKIHGRIGRDAQFKLRKSLHLEYTAARDKLEDEYFSKDLEVSHEVYGPFKELQQHYIDVKESLAGRDSAFIGLVNVLKRFSNTNQFHFTYTNDFRGRIYPNAIYMSPQGSDLEKAVMEFAKPTKVGPRERYWQEWNLASLIVEASTIEEDSDVSLDKLLPDERVSWIKRNWGRLEEIAREPTINDCWHKWEKPYLAMAQLLEMVYTPHETRQPIAVDATCSGLQFLAAIGRDEHVGKAVNLTASNKREDVYLFVADKIRVDLKGHPFWGNKLYTRNIWRKLVKRCVMVFGYAGTRYGMGDIVYTDGKDLLKKKFADKPEASNLTRKNAVFLGNLIYDSLPSILPKPEAIMTFLTTATKRVTAKKIREGIEDPEKLAIHWFSPSGFKVYQYAEKFEANSLYFSFMGDICVNTLRHNKVFKTMKQSSVRLSIAMPEDAYFNARGMPSSAAPNFIHSFDAALAVKTILAMDRVKLLEMASFCHDSFGVSADRVDELNCTVRKEFVKMFDKSYNVLEGFNAANGIDRSLFDMTTKDKLAATKKGISESQAQLDLYAIYDNAMSQGKLNIKEVLDNPFFFS